MVRAFRIFFGAEGTKPWLVLFCLLLGGILEAVGIGTLLPVASLLLNETAQPKGAFEQATATVLEYLHVPQTLGSLLLLVFAIMVARSLFLFVAMSYAGITGSRVTILLRRRLLRAVFNAKWSFYAEQSAGQVANSISNDATRAGDAYLQSASAITTLLQVIAYAAIALFINWKVAFAALAGSIVLTIPSMRLVRTVKKAGFKQADRTSMIASETADMLQNIKPLKSMHRYDALLDNIGTILKRLKKSLFTRFLARSGLTYGNDVMVMGMVCLGAWLAVRFAGISVSQLLVIGLLFFQLISYVTKYLKQLQMAVEFEGSYVRLMEFIENAERQEEVSPGTLAPPARVDLHFENVSFAHGDRNILNDISLVIPANRITVIQGPSGAGKTTLIDLLIGFHKPDRGMIRIGETPLSDIETKAWRSTIGYVPQELSLFHDSVKANITLLESGITDEMVQNAIRLAGVAEFLSHLPQGLETDVGELGGKISGGQRQRISLARALVRQPKLLILDEVTSALDPETEAGIVTNIKALGGHYTIVAITHRPAWTEIADRLYTLKDGQIISTTKGNRRAS